MPSRIIRDRILSSESLARLSHPAERLFYRLVVLVDDHGRYHGSPQYVRHAAMPLLEVSTQDVGRWLAELAEADVVCLYRVSGRDFLHLTTWAKWQRLRAKESKFPIHEEGTCGHLRSNVSVNNRNAARSHKKRSATTRPEDRIAKDESFQPHDASIRGQMRPESETESERRKTRPNGRREGAPRPKDVIWKVGVSLLVGQGVPEPSARSLLGRVVSQRGEEKLAAKIAAAAVNPPINFRSVLADWIAPKATRFLG